jgi:hypothetical protein
MPSTAPIACTLTAAQYRQRTDDIARLARAALRDRRRIDGGVRLTFDAAARERLEAFAAAEAACCPFLALDLRAAAGGLVLDVTGPAAAGPVIEELFASSGPG